MGDSYLADIPNNQFTMQEGNLASRASNAADAIIPLGIIEHAGKVLSANHIPVAASQAGSATNYADVKIVNLGSDGTGTAVLASKSYSATATSIASNAKGSMAVASAPTFAAGDVIGVSYASQGNGIALVAHSLAITYQLT